MHMTCHQGYSAIPERSADITTPKWDINHTVIDVAPSGLLTLHYRDMVIFEIHEYLVCHYL